MVKTKRYALEAFLEGDSYYSAAEKRRFSTVDNQLNRVSEIVGDGRIEGWEISSNFPEITISAGSGLIDKFYVNTYDDKTTEISSDDLFYVYAQRRIGIIAATGPKSDVNHVNYIDSGPPNSPSSLNLTINQPFYVILDWEDNTEKDISHYEIERSTDNISFELISKVEQSAYQDTTEEDTLYYYKVYAVDQSGNRSNPSVINVTTPLSDVLPPNPTNVQFVISESAVNVLWKKPISIPFSKVSYYLLEIITLNSDNSEISSTAKTITISKDLLNERIEELQNGQKYKLTLKTVDYKDRISEGVSGNVIPQSSNAPRDPTAIAFTMSPSPGGVQVNLSWIDGDTPYDPAISFRYRIYVTVDGQQESLGIDVPIGFTEEQLSLYTFNLVEYFSIPENSIVTFRITALDQTGFESFGNFLRIETALFSLPSRIRDLASSFNPELGTIEVTWLNQIDTNDINIVILVDNLDDAYLFDEEIANENIGKAEKYIISNVSLNNKYTIQVTPINVDGVYGAISTVIELTTIPGGLALPSNPSLVQGKVGDRQIELTWVASTSLYASKYNIYKKNGTVSFRTSDWRLLDVLPYNVTKFIDYGLENDDTYSYYITSVDIYGRESLHLPDGAINLNFVEITPRSSGSLTHPDITNVSINSDNHVVITWESLSEEFDAFSLYRSIDNLHSWTLIKTLDRNTFSYTDIELPLIDGTTFYYTLDKSVNDADIVVQTSSSAPENSLLLAKVTTDTNSVVSIDVSGRRDIKDLLDPLTEYTNKYILPHKHREILELDPDRIDLNPELIITDWTTVDGRIFTTQERDINGTNFIVKVNEHFPSVFYTVDPMTRSLIFAEPIVTLDPTTGAIIGEIPTIEVRVLGIEEVDNVLPESRFDLIHARQVAFGTLAKEQLPEINHEGRIQEKLIPKSFLLEKYNNFNFVVPQSNTDTTKNFGDGTVFYAVESFDGEINQLFDFDLDDNNDIVAFNKPSYSSTTINNLKKYISNSEVNNVSDIANDYIFDTDRIYLTSNSEFWSLNKNTIEKDKISNISFSGLTSSTVDSKNNLCYLLQSITNVSHSLYKFDITDGSTSDSLILTPGADKSFTDIEFNSDNNTLYAILRDTSVSPSTHELVRINTSSGVITSIGSVDPQAGGDDVSVYITYDEVSNIMYGINDDTDVVKSRLFSINLSTAATTVIGSTSSSEGITGITFDYTAQSSSSIYGITSSNIIYINSSTGAATVVGAHNISSVKTIFSAPYDKSFYINPNDSVPGNNELRLGNFYGLSTVVYLRFPIELNKNNSVVESLLHFNALNSNPSNGNSVRLNLSILDPSAYDDTVDLSSEIIKTLNTIGNIVWSPLPWEHNEDSDNTSIDVKSLLQSFIDSDSFYSGKHIIFKIETLDTSSSGEFRKAQSFNENPPYLDTNYVMSFAGVTDDPAGFQSEKSYHLQFEFEDSDPTRWVRVVTAGAEKSPNPIIDFEKRLRFRILLTQGSLYVTLGLRETTVQPDSQVGDDGGTSGPVEWAGVDSVITDQNDEKVPLGILIESSDEWQEINIDLTRTKIYGFEDGNSSLNKGLGVLEHIAFTAADSSYSGIYNVYLDEFQQVSDVLVSGTSQGLQVSRDFGRTWSVARLTDTAVHKFYKAKNNPYLWAISANQVFLSSDPEFWFVPQGTTGIQFIHDIVEDDSGNIYISSDKGVYKLDISLINNYSVFRQTQPVNAFTTDCYALYHNNLSSGDDEIWVSTEIGIYKTNNGGESWISTSMDTGGLVCYQLMNIGTKKDPNIVGINRKHFLRKLKNDINFQVITDFESEHNEFSLWKFEFFAGQIYISGSTGVYVNSLSDLFTPGISGIPFTRVFDGLDINGVDGIAFGLDTIDSGTDSSVLFIGQENRLLTSDESKFLTTKSRYFNKEYPSFFINKDEKNIGFIYNAFNKVISFREPLSTLDIVYCTYLPRKIYIAQKYGWAYTNPSADVFIYKNGIPTWLDWKLDNATILGELQIVEGNLNNLPTLSTFNSLYPKSQELLELCLADIAKIRTGGENGSALINNDTIVSFLNDYSRFLSVISDKIKTDNNLNLPQILLTGISRQDRLPDSRASVLEAKEDFESNDSTSITIDTVTGTVDFLQAFTLSTDIEKRNALTFDKYDDLKITIFNANIKNTGEFTHRELEDRMEEVNTGLTSHLQLAAITNLIRAGIFFERENHYLFNRFNVSNIQSKFNAAFTNEWYDILNSTIDYSLIVNVKNSENIRFCNVIKSIETNDPYIINKIWIGTDSLILEYSLDDNTLVLQKTLSPQDNLFIWDIYQYQNSIYVIAEDKNGLGYIYLTQDEGETWDEIKTTNLPNRIYSINIINGNLIVSTEKGVFYSDNSFGTWFECNLVTSEKLGSNSISVDAFRLPILNLSKNIFSITESDRWFYTSSQGIEFFSLGRITNNDCTVVNKILRYKNLTYVATDKGLYNDGNSILSDLVQFGLEASLDGDADKSVNVKVNDITAGKALYCCSSAGYVYRFYDSGNGNQWSKYFVPEFGPIHKIHLIETETIDYLLISSFNMLKLINVTIGSGVFDV